MTFVLCLMTTGASALDPIVPLLVKSNICVWTACSARDYVADIRSASTQCLIVDMEGAAGPQTLRALRNKGVGTPALLITDEPAARAEQLNALDVLPRPADVRVLLSWIECICAAHMVLGKREKLLNLLIAFKQVRDKPEAKLKTRCPEPVRKAVNA
jgi:FixJ family two-component response regulator